MTQEKNIKKEESEGMEFDVMPDAQSNPPVPSESNEPPPEPDKGGKKIVPPVPNSQNSGKEEGGKRKYLMILIGAAAVAALLGGGYFVYNSYFSGDDSEGGLDITLPDDEDEEQNALLTDSDNDGLVGEREVELGTDPENPDTDGDGFADGDEVNIYETNPLLQDTDGDGFEDSQEPAFGFSPIENSTEKASAEEVQKWEDRIAEFGLHEPTKSTLILRQQEADGEEAGEAKVYENKQYGYQLEVPAVLDYRESEDGMRVGFYVVGTDPEGEEIARDPIHISIAIREADLSLDEWINAQYGQEDYQSKEEMETDAAAIKLRGVNTQTSCLADETFYSKEESSRIITLTLSCNQNEDFLEIYDRMAGSFKFN